MIRKGDVVTFKPEWSDKGDDEISFVAVEDEDGGRVLVKAQLGYRFDPVQTVPVEYLYVDETQAGLEQC